jgi:hypothetical protein
MVLETIKQLGKIKSGNSFSAWKCPFHDHMIQKNVTYKDIESVGIPICSECGDDMEFISERWEPKKYKKRK